MQIRWGYTLSEEAGTEEVERSLGMEEKELQRLKTV